MEAMFGNNHKQTNKPHRKPGGGGVGGVGGGGGGGGGRL